MQPFYGNTQNAWILIIHFVTKRFTLIYMYTLLLQFKTYGFNVIVDVF